MILPQISRPLIMGILNITPDSFSDGGEFFDRDKAAAHALELVEEGADILDLGGESTRPGAERIDADRQIDRVLPVIEELFKALPQGYPVSIDTTLAAVAEQAIQAGASIINDISAGEDDESMFPLAAATGVDIILMHKQGAPATMQERPCYDNVVEELREYLLARAAVAQQTGVRQQNIIIDPGIGFGKTREHNLAIMENLKRFVDTGYPVLLGASRKSFLKKLSHVEDSRGLVGATCATTVMGLMAGVRILRVHDVKQNRQALDVAYALNVSRYS
jgi:dihydropteroate synthase